MLNRRALFATLFAGLVGAPAIRKSEPRQLRVRWYTVRRKMLLRNPAAFKNSAGVPFPLVEIDYLNWICETEYGV